MTAWNRRARRLFAAVLLGIAFAAPDASAFTEYAPRVTDPLLDATRWRSFPELRGRGLRCLAEDSARAIWFGTSDGVLRYDGLRWTAFSEADGLFPGPVNALLAASDGTVYAGSDFGISAYRDSTWIRLFPLGNDIPWPIDRVVEADHGVIWVASAWGALQFIPNAAPRLWTTREMSRVVREMEDVEIVEVPDEVLPGREWSPGIGIRVARGSFISAYRGHVSEMVWAVAPGSPADSAGIRTGDRVLRAEGGTVTHDDMPLTGPPGSPAVLTVARHSRQDTVQLELESADLTGQTRGFSVSDVMVARDGALWFGASWDRYAIRYDPARGGPGVPGAWTLYDATDDLAWEVRVRLMQDRAGTVWAISAESGGGIYRLVDGVWRTEQRPGEALTINLSMMETRDGAVWVGAHMGEILRYVEGAWTIYSIGEIPTPRGRVIDLLETADGDVWVAGVGQGAVRLHYGSDRWRSYTDIRFQCEDTAGRLWFTDADLGVVCREGDRWRRYTSRDGLMDVPDAIFAARGGDVWVVGKHGDVAAAARLRGDGPEASFWELTLHQGLAVSLDPNAFLDADDGSVWFSGYDVPDGCDGGLVRFDGGRWQRYSRSVSMLHAYAAAQTPDGVMWFGGQSLVRFDGTTWRAFREPEPLASWIHDLCVARDGRLWVATRAFGVLCFDGSDWAQFTVRDGLADNHVDAVMETSSGDVWAATRGGISCFRDSSWVTYVMPETIVSQGLRGALRETSDGAIWIAGHLGSGSEARWSALRYIPDREPPETRVIRPPAAVGREGNAVIAWAGVDPWRDTPDDELQFSYRLDDGPWTKYLAQTTAWLVSLPSGPHTFEVRARDRDMNVDATPERITFSVAYPVWSQGWFLSLLGAFVIGIGLQTTRVIRRDRALRQVNTALVKANGELNVALEGQRLDRCGEEIRAQVQSMEKAADFDSVLATVATDLRTVGIRFDRCQADMLEAPVFDASLPAYLEHGFQLIRFTLDPEGRVTRTSRAADPPVDADSAGIIRRIVAGSVEAGNADGKASLDVPIGQFGRLRITSATVPAYGEEDVRVVKHFGVAIALGYSRFLDFVSIERQNRSLGRAHAEVSRANQAKSIFLANMSHELRTPLTSVIAMSEVLLEQFFGALNDKQVEYLKDIHDSGHHLLTLINDVLDLSKIEAGHSPLELSDVDIEDLVSDAMTFVRETATRNGIVLRSEAVSNLPVVRADERKVKQALINLLANAVKFTREGGKVGVRVVPENGQVRLSVWDTGIGIAPEDQERIFEQFEQADASVVKRYEGTGLGLTLVKRLVEQHEGRVELQSEPGKGSTFSVVLPVAGPSATKAGRSLADAQKARLLP